MLIITLHFTPIISVILCVSGPIAPGQNRGPYIHICDVWETAHFLVGVYQTTYITFLCCACKIVLSYKATCLRSQRSSLSSGHYCSWRHYMNRCDIEWKLYSKKILQEHCSSFSVVSVFILFLKQFATFTYQMFCRLILFFLIANISVFLLYYIHFYN